MTGAGTYNNEHYFPPFETSIMRVMFTRVRVMFFVDFSTFSEQWNWRFLRKAMSLFHSKTEAQKCLRFHQNLPKGTIQPRPHFEKSIM
jgi:hypothetical protein